MKTIYRNIALLFIAAISFSSCDEETLEYSSSQTEKGFPVELTLSYQIAMPKEIESRATTDVEKQLKELQIFVFSADEDGDDSNNVLKGYKRITTGLVNNTSNSTNTTGSFAIKTTTGSSYIYGIANANTTVYNVEDIAASDWTEENAQSGAYILTLADFKAKNFNRLYKIEDDKIVQAVNPSDDYFVMSGVMNDGKPVTITANADGTTGSLDANEGNIIKLKRILSKVSFNFKNGTTNKPQFTLTQYDICNIPVTGKIIENNQPTRSAAYSNMEGNIPSALNSNAIQFYLPENLQTSLNNVNSQKERENNTYTADGVKTFDNAPEDATYIVAKGKYSDNTGIVADVEYTIHLGDITKSLNNYHNERNCEYTYNITVKGVNDIIVEAKRVDEDDESDYNQGVEGIVLNPKRGKVFTLDSHYESCVMRFSQTDIQKLIVTELGGYVFQVETFGNKSEIFVVNDEWDDKKLEGIDYQWITFAKGGTYIEDDTKGGTPLTYTSTNPKPGEATTQISDLYTVPELLKYLRDNANVESAWTNDGYMTFTCFVNENYYTDRKWGEFVNINPRKLYIANNVFESSDTKSVYAEVAYAIEQRSIQTFYNRDNDNIVAYGCETVDETYTGSNYSGTGTNGAVNTFDGRQDMIKYLANNQRTWSNYTTTFSRAIDACMSRNRDLNRDGTITKDEVRWYIPSYAQYSGLWIGEEALKTEARLYNMDKLPSSTNIMRYYANTTGRTMVWAEEGSSFQNSTSNKYIKCIRNLRSKNANVEEQGTSLNSTDQDKNSKAQIADRFYIYNSDKRTFDLSSLVDQTALRVFPQYEELGLHHEREPLNKIRTKFIVASMNLKEYNNIGVTLEKVLNKTVICNGHYPNGQTENYNDGWRVPNQRELSLMVLENGNGYYLTPTGLEGSTFQTGSNRGIYSLTNFSNPDHRIGFGFGNNNWNSTDFRMYTYNQRTTTGWVRCVRDVE